MQAKTALTRKGSLGKKRSGLLSGILLALFWTVGLSAALSLLCTLILSRCTDGTAYIKILGSALSAALAFTGGLIAGRRSGQTGALAGVLFGVLYLLLMLLLASLLGGEGVLWKRLVSYAVLLLLSTLGGAAGTVERRRPHARHRRR